MSIFNYINRLATNANESQYYLYNALAVGDSALCLTFRSTVSSSDDKNIV